MKFLEPLYQSFKKKFVPLIKKRLDRTKFSGLPITILGIIFFYIFLLFFGVAESLVTSGIILDFDMRVNTFFHTFRDPIIENFFLWITLLGEITIIIISTLAVSIYLWLLQKKWQAVGLWVSIVGSEGFTYITKYIIHRPRPVGAVLLEDSFAFPSGHATAAVAFYGFLAYLIICGLKNKRYRIFTLLSSFIVILAVGFSRLYLGVHYVSDVWAGYLMGILWLMFAISIVEWRSCQKTKPVFIP